MSTSLVDVFDLAMLTQLVPFIMVVLAIIFLMIAKMTRLPLGIIFVPTLLFLVGAWTVGFGDAIHVMREPVFGFFIDSVGQLGLKILLPAVMVICVMIMRKEITASKKIEALLLVLISCFGAMVTLTSYNWMLFFIGLQCLSLPIYGLLAFDPDDRGSLSSSARYLLLSFVAMAILLFGILLLYAATGTMELVQQTKILKALEPEMQGIVSLALIMLFVGLAFKVSLFPFHAWAPEVYNGARLFVISYLVVVVKSVVIIFLLRSTLLLIGTNTMPLNSIITFMAILSMWVGNGMMLRETNVIRLLAFLSIGHLGALMIPLLAHNNLTIDAIFLDIISFGLAMLLVFASLKGITYDRRRGLHIADLKNLSSTRPWASLTLAIAFISLTGFPLTAGFVGKFAILQSGVDAQLWHLIAHFIVSSVVGLAVIAKVIALMWQKSADETVVITRAPEQLPEIIFCAALAIVVMGVFPEAIIAWVKTYTTSVLPL